jgi:hypothetical protein
MKIPELTSEQVIQNTIAKVNEVTTRASQAIDPIGTAALQAGQEVQVAADQFTTSISTGFGDIVQAVEQAKRQLGQNHDEMLRMLGELLDSLPKAPGMEEIRKILDDAIPDAVVLNGKGYSDPDAFYLEVRRLLGSTSANRAAQGTITIELRGPQFLALHQAANAKDSNAAHQALRNAVFPGFRLSLNSKILNSDPVTITALICVTIMVLGIGLGTPIAVGSGVAVSAMFLAIAAALIIATAQGRPVELSTCPKSGNEFKLPDGSSVGTDFLMCTTLTLPPAT